MLTVHNSLTASLVSTAASLFALFRNQHSHDVARSKAVAAIAM